MNEYKKSSFIANAKPWLQCSCSLWMHDFSKSSFIINAILSLPSQRTNIGNPKNGNISRYYQPFFAKDTDLCKN
jgi:hypothetical protein